MLTFFTLISPWSTVSLTGHSMLIRWRCCIVAKSSHSPAGILWIGACAVLNSARSKLHLTRGRVFVRPRLESGRVVAFAFVIIFVALCRVFCGRRWCWFCCWKIQWRNVLLFNLQTAIVVLQLKFYIQDVWKWVNWISFKQTLWDCEKEKGQIVGIVNVYAANISFLEIDKHNSNLEYAHLE